MIEKLLKAVSLNDGEEVELSLKEEIICTIISFLIIGLLLYFAATSSEALSANNEKVAEDTTYTESTLPHAWGIIRYGDTGAYLEKDGNRISDYYKVIEEDYDYDTLRVIGMSGLYGFISKYTGAEQIKPCFKEASPMNYHSACVSEDGKNYYFIDENGNKMTGDYEEAYPWECQGQYARVKTMDSWGIINRRGKTLFDKCTMINPLPDVTTTIGTAFRNDKGLLFCILQDIRDIQYFRSRDCDMHLLTDLEVRPLLHCVLHGNEVPHIHCSRTSVHLTALHRNDIHRIQEYLLLPGIQNICSMYHLNNVTKYVHTEVFYDC